MITSKPTLAALIPLLLPCSVWAQDEADLILTGGRIATLAYEEGFVEAIAIKDGLVHAVGSDAEVLELAGDSTRRVDLDGRTVVPGLNERDGVLNDGIAVHQVAMGAVDDHEIRHAEDTGTFDRDFAIVVVWQDARHPRIDRSYARDNAKFKVYRAEPRRHAVFVCSQLHARRS